MNVSTILFVFYTNDTFSKINGFNKSERLILVKFLTKIPFQATKSQLMN